MAADVARHFAAARRVAHERGARQVQRVDQGGQVVGIGIHVVALERLAGAAMAAPVVGNDAVAAHSQVKHLVFPGVGRQGPAVAEDDGRAAAPVLVVDQGAVGGTQGIAWMQVGDSHGTLLVGGPAAIVAAMARARRALRQSIAVE